MNRLGSTVARLKLKGIDGGPHKRWSMWFNSTQREEPYLGLTSCERPRDWTVPSGAQRQVLHGCRQLVSRDVWLSPATSATLIFSCQHIKVGTLKRLPGLTGRKAGMTSSPHGPYVQGYTRATMVNTEGSKPATVSESLKFISVRIGVCNSTP